MAKTGRKPKRKILTSNMKVKLILIFGVLLFGFAFLLCKIIYVDVVKGDRYERNVLAQRSYDSVNIPFRRGDITDRNGIVLATSEKVYNLVIEPKNIVADDNKRAATVQALAKYFNVTEADLNTYLADEESLYKVVLKQLSYDEMIAFEELMDSKEGKDIVGVWFEDEYHRTYPNGKLACHVLGYTNSGNVGNGGIEGYYNDSLNGSDGKMYGHLNADSTMDANIKPPINGYTVVSTVDSNIQKIIEDVVDQYMEEIGAENVSVLCMDPNDGSILGLYNCHYYDPNDPYDLTRVYYQFRGTDDEIQEELDAMSDEEQVKALNKLWRNYVINDTFEPGSTFKTFVMSAGLEENAISTSDTFYCNGSLPVDRYDIRCHKKEGHKNETLIEGFGNSCNVVFMTVGSRIGRKTFAKYEKVFGFGLKTNVDLPGEARTAELIYDEDGLNEVELATSSFGQGLNVTMIQLASAFCSVVNGGDYYQPHIVSKILDENGNLVENYEGTILRRTISEDTSQIMKDALLQVVEDGTAASRGQIDGYSIGGKTGTAEKLPRGSGEYILSFIGACPIENPQVVLYVTVDQPRVENPDHSGMGTVIAKSIFERLLPYMNIYKTGDEDTSDQASVSPEGGASMEERNPSDEETNNNEDQESDNNRDNDR